jgi:hypothetical protein
MLLGAYYYGWYSQNWLSRTVRQTDPPILGEYNNTIYSDVIHKQMEMMKQGGIDFISVSWQGEDHGHILDAANKTGVKVTYFYESLKWAKKGKVPLDALDGIIKDMDGLIEAMQESSWFKIDGRPVLMVYVTRCYRESPEKIFEAIRAKIPNVFIVADELFWGDIPDSKIRLFDAITAYNMYKPGKFSTASPEETARTYLENSINMMTIHSKQCQRLNIPLWGNAIPGYNDLGVRPDQKHHPVPRLDGEFFKISLEDAAKVSSSSKVIIVTSYGEWYEDTQIEPAISYDYLYLDILRNFKNKCLLEK